MFGGKSVRIFTVSLLQQLLKIFPSLPSSRLLLSLWLLVIRSSTCAKLVLLLIQDISMSRYIDRSNGSGFKLTRTFGGGMFLVGVFPLLVCLLTLMFSFVLRTVCYLYCIEIFLLPCTVPRYPRVFVSEHTDQLISGPVDRLGLYCTQGRWSCCLYILALTPFLIPHQRRIGNPARL